MRIYIKDIKPDGIAVSDNIASEVIGLNENDIIRILTPLKVNALIDKTGNAVIAETKINLKFSTLCSRCLEVVEQDWSQEFTLTYSVHRSTEFIELDDEIRQEVILGMPMRTMCQENCKGICANCGVNLNKEECKCSKKG